MKKITDRMRLNWLEKNSKKVRLSGSWWSLEIKGWLPAFTGLRSAINAAIRAERRGGGEGK